MPCFNSENDITFIMTFYVSNVQNYMYVISTFSKFILPFLNQPAAMKRLSHFPLKFSFILQPYLQCFYWFEPVFEIERNRNERVASDDI